MTTKIKFNDLSFLLQVGIIGGLLFVGNLLILIFVVLFG